jgi:hypothetical protein
MEIENTNVNEKIPPVFIIKIINFIKLREEISSILHNDFNATNKNQRRDNRWLSCDHKIFRRKRIRILHV